MVLKKEREKKKTKKLNKKEEKKEDETCRQERQKDWFISLGTISFKSFLPVGKFIIARDHLAWRTREKNVLILSKELGQI